MKKEKKDKHFIKKPYYEGGLTALRAFIRKNMKYPKAALKAKTEGTVFVKYSIDYKGKVTTAKVVSSLGNGCDEEAIRLVKMLKFEVPKMRKMRIVYHKSIQINFRLPKQKEKTKSNIQYTVTTKAKKETKESKKKEGGGSYNYTITY